MVSTLSFEYAHWSAGRVVAGLDEAGRGAWAGPVVAGAVILPPEPVLLAEALAEVDDSKKLRPAVRERLDERIRAVAEVGVGTVSAAEIDEMGIVPATMRAMTLALAALPTPPAFLLIDHIPRPLPMWAQRRLVRGESQSMSIAAASIVAKVHRDRLMVEYDEVYPGYAFASHKGYGTAYHHYKLERLGATPIHRCTWSPMLQMRLPLEAIS